MHVIAIIYYSHLDLNPLRQRGAVHIPKNMVIRFHVTVFFFAPLFLFTLFIGVTRWKWMHFYLIVFGMVL